MTRRVLAILLLVVTMLPVVGQAADKKTGKRTGNLRTQAQELIQKAKGLYTSGKQKEARDLFNKAQALLKEANLAANQLNTKRDESLRSFDRLFKQSGSLQKKVPQAVQRIRELQAEAKRLTAKGQKDAAEKVQAQLQAAQKALELLTKDVRAAQIEAMHAALANLPYRQFGPRDLKVERDVLLKRADVAEKSGQPAKAAKLRAAAKVLGKKGDRIDQQSKSNRKATRRESKIGADLTVPRVDTVQRPKLKKSTLSEADIAKYRKAQQKLSQRLRKAAEASDTYLNKRSVQSKQAYRKRFAQAVGRTKTTKKTTPKAISGSKAVTRKLPKTEQRIRHLLAAAENLAAAGFKTKSQELVEEAERLRNGVVRQKKASRGEKNREIDELRGNVNRLSKQVDRLSQLVEKLIEKQSKNNSDKK